MPVPVSTPYDADPKAEAIYLEEYFKAYRLVLAEVNVGCHMGVKGPYEEPFRKGWIDGRTMAMKTHPEKSARMSGLSLNEYLRSVKNNE